MSTNKNPKDVVAQAVVTISKRMAQELEDYWLKSPGRISGGGGSAVPGTSTVTIGKETPYMRIPQDDIIDALDRAVYCVKGGAFGKAFEHLCQILPHIVEQGVLDNDSGLWDRLLGEKDAPWEWSSPWAKATVRVSVEVKK